MRELTLNYESADQTANGQDWLRVIRLLIWGIFCFVIFPFAGFVFSYQASWKYTYSTSIVPKPVTGADLFLVWIWFILSVVLGIVLFVFIVKRISRNRS